MKSASDVAQKWARNLSNSTSSITSGVAALTTSPTAAAANAANLWQQRVSSPASLDKFKRNLGKVSLDSWKQAMTNKGIPRISTGAQNAQPKFEQFMSDFLPFVNSVAQRVRSMPKVTLDDRIQRMVAQVRGNATYVRK